MEMLLGATYILTTLQQSMNKERFQSVAMNAFDLFCALGWSFGYGKKPPEETPMWEQDTEEFIPISPYLFMEDDE